MSLTSTDRIDADVEDCRKSHPVRSAIYSWSLRQMFRLDPETIHSLMTKALGIFQRMPMANRALERCWAEN